MKPEMLTHPHIPKPLHGMNPRNILGNEWWDTIRQEAYKRYDYHCVACGIHKSKAIYHKWLEAHEYWNINYNTGICKVESIEPLCHSCHSFIHSGRLSMILGKTKSVQHIKAILHHGFNILSIHNLECFPFTLKFAKNLNVETFKVKAYKLDINPKLGWKDYILILNNKEYKSKFKSEKEWKDYYK